MGENIAFSDNREKKRLKRVLNRLGEYFPIGGRFRAVYAFLIRCTDSKFLKIKRAIWYEE